MANQDSEKKAVKAPRAQLVNPPVAPMATPAPVATPNQASQYKPIPPLEPQMDPNSKQEIDSGFHKGAAGAIGTYVGPGMDANQQPYAIYQRNGQRIGVQQGDDQYSYKKLDLSDPNSSWQTVQVPGGDQYRKMADFLRNNRNPFDPNGVWKKEPVQMTPGELTENFNKVNTYNNLQPPSGSEIDQFTGTAKTLKALQSVRDLYGQLGTEKFNSVSQAILKAPNLLNVDPKAIGVPQKDFELYTRLQQALQHAANEGADVAGIPGGSNGNELGNRVGNWMSNIGLITRTPAGIAAAAGIQGVGELAKAAADNTVNINALRSSLVPTTDEIRQAFHEQVASRVGTVRLPDEIRNDANREADLAYKDGVGPTENAYTVAPYLDQTEKTTEGSLPFQANPQPSAMPTPQGQPKPLPEPTQSPSNQQTPAGNPSAIDNTINNAALPPATRQFLREDVAPSLKGIGDWWNKTFSGYPDNISGGQVPKAPIQAPSPAPAELPAAPINRDQRPPGFFNTGQIPEEHGSYAESLPVASEQGHVDALQPGTPFRWGLDGQAYVKT